MTAVAIVVILVLALALGAVILNSRRTPTAFEREAAVDAQASSAVAEEEELTTSAAEQQAAAEADRPLGAAERAVVRERAGTDD